MIFVHYCFWIRCHDPIRIVTGARTSTLVRQALWSNLSTINKIFSRITFTSKIIYKMRG
jgi:hypothetical protein